MRKPAKPTGIPKTARLLVAVVGVFLAVPSVARAQSFPRVEAFLGLSYMRPALAARDGNECPKGDLIVGPGEAKER